MLLKRQHYFQSIDQSNKKKEKKRKEREKTKIVLANFGFERFFVLAQQNNMNFQTTQVITLSQNKHFQTQNFKFLNFFCENFISVFLFLCERDFSCLLFSHLKLKQISSMQKVVITVSDFQLVCYYQKTYCQNNFFPLFFILLFCFF